jgi:hypothetical protein
MCHDRFRLSNVIDVLIWSIVRFEIEQNTYFTVDSLYTIHNIQFTVAYGITKEWNDALKNTDPRSDACYTLPVHSCHSYTSYYIVPLCIYKS